MDSFLLSYSMHWLTTWCSRNILLSFFRLCAGWGRDLRVTVFSTRFFSQLLFQLLDAFQIHISFIIKLLPQCLSTLCNRTNSNLTSCWASASLHCSWHGSNFQPAPLAQLVASRSFASIRLLFPFPAAMIELSFLLHILQRLTNISQLGSSSLSLTALTNFCWSSCMRARRCSAPLPSSSSITVHGL